MVRARLRRLGFAAAACAVGLGLLASVADVASADPQPNLQVSGLRGTPSSDQTRLTVQFTVTNTGSAPSGTFAWTAYLSPTTNVADQVATLLANSAQASLAANGGAFSKNVSVALPTGLTAGTYYLLLQLPASVTASAPITLSSTPNLVLSGFTAPASVAPTAGSAAVGFTVANTGAGPAAATHVGVYLSSDAAISGDDTQLSEISVDPLAVSATRSYQVTVPLPSSLVPARYYLIARANDVAADGVSETRTDDNTGSAQIVSLAPDLVVHSISAPSSVNGLGASAQINFTIGNSGTQRVDSSTQWALYLTPNETTPTGGTPFATGSVAPLNGGDFSSSVSLVVALPLVPAGHWCVYVKADASDQIAEYDEGNNWSHACITVLTALDLTPTAFTAPSSVSFLGGSLQASVTVANNGNAPSGDSVLAFYLSRSASLDTSSALQVGTAQVASIPAFASSVVNVSLTVPAATVGRYTLFAVADAANAVSEVDESNNTASQTLDLLAPDLKPQVTQPAQDGRAGSPVSVAFTVANAGTDAAAATAWKLYLSDDGTLAGATDLGVGGSVPALAAGATSTAIQASATVPAGTLPGRHCVVVAVDPAGAVAESDETNNLASSCFTVVDSTPPVSSGSVSPSAPASGWYTAPVSVSVTATDLGGVKEIHYVVDGHETVVAGSSASFTVSGDGTHTVSWFAVDTAGNAEQAHQTTVKLDAAAPLVSCAAGPSSWQAANVSVACTASDGTSGLATPGDASFSLSTSVPAGSEDAAAATGSRHVCDVAGNCADAGPFHFQVDRKAPTVSCAPPDSQPWHASDVTFTCTVTDGGSGPVEPGFTLSTSVPDGTENAAAPTGSHQACDAVGNCAAPTSLTAAVDKKAPTVSCPSAGSDWHRADASFDCTVADGGSGPVAPTVRLTAQAPADAETTLSTGTAEACDVAGNCVTAGPVAGVRFDTKAPVISCSPPAQGSWYRADVSVPCTATDGGSGPAAGDASFSLTAAVPAGTASAAVATGPREVCDAAGNCADAPRYEFKIDEQAPQVSCPQPDGAWHAGDVSYACSADDGAGSGLANGADAAFTLATSVPAGQEDAAAPAGSRTVCDLAGNCAAPVSRTAMVDRKAPTVSCPSAGSDWHRTDASFDCTVADGGSGPVASTVRLTAQAPANAETTLPTGSGQACDRVGNCTTAGPIAGVRFDTKAPTFSCDQPDGAWHKGPVSLVCHGQDGGSGLAGPPTLTLTASVADGVEDAAAFTGAGSFCDAAGNCATVPALGPIKLDRKAPTVTCPAADSAWHTDNVTFTCTAADTGSGPASATVQLATSVAAGSETANASTAAQQACDAVGNCAPAGPVTGVKVDRKAPTVTIAAPSGVYVIGADVTADYSCADGGSGVSLCAGLLPDGAPVDTSRIGTRPFAVAARDAAGHLAAATSSYTVTYGVCVPQDVPRGPVGGKTVRVWLTICDADGRDISSKSMDLTAVGVDSGPVPALPGNRDFHYEQKFGFRYDLDGSRLAAGTHTLRFTIEGDPVVHTVRFTTPK